MVREKILCGHGCGWENAQASSSTSYSAGYIVVQHLFTVDVGLEYTVWPNAFLSQQT